MDEAPPETKPMSRRDFLFKGSALLGALMGMGAVSKGAEAKVEQAPGNEQVKLTSERLDGVETWGNNQPLSQKEYQLLLKNLNKAFDSFTPQEKKEYLREDTYYSTMFISKTEYKNFQEKGGESFQRFLKRHEAAMNQVFANSNMDTNFRIRRLVIVEDGVDVARSHTQRYLTEGVADSDGVWYFSEGAFGDNWPNDLSYYDKQQRIDWGLIHEWGHAVLRLPDHYVDDYHYTEKDYWLLFLPEVWREYLASRRPDLSLNDLMYANVPTFQEFSRLQLERRVAMGTVHDKKRLNEIELYGWPKEFPADVEFQFVDEDGKPLEISGMSIYRSERLIAAEGDVNAFYYDKRMSETPVYSGDGKNVVPEKIFSSNEQVVKFGSGAILILMDTNNGLYFRWMDIRDFIFARWRGFDGKVKMKLLATNGKLDPGQLDWSVEYSGA